MVALASPYTGTVLDVADDLVDRYVEAGWGHVDDDGHATGSDGLFDPSEHNGEVVIDHLKDALADEDLDEFNRVIDAERRGKERSTVLALADKAPASGDESDPDESGRDSNG